MIFSKLKNIKFIVLILLLVKLNAETLKGGYEACISEKLFDEFTTAVVKNDKNALHYLLNNGCVITKKGIQVSVLDTTWTGKAKVRAYIGNSAIILWTPVENIIK